MDIGKIIRHARKMKDLSQAKVAEMALISRASYSQIEITGKVKEDTKERIYKVLEITGSTANDEMAYYGKNFVAEKDQEIERLRKENQNLENHTLTQNKLILFLEREILALQQQVQDLSKQLEQLMKA